MNRSTVWMVELADRRLVRLVADARPPELFLSFAPEQPLIYWTGVTAEWSPAIWRQEVDLENGTAVGELSLVRAGAESCSRPRCPDRRSPVFYR